MKTLKTFLAIAIIAILGSCSKDDTTTELPIATPISNNYRIISDANSNYEYDQDGRLTKSVKKTASSEFVKYTYNSKGKITQKEDTSNTNNYIYDYTTYVYDSNEKVVSTIRTNKSISSGAVELKFKTDFIYNSSGQIIRKNYSQFVTNQFVLNPEFSTFEYNSLGKISKIINPSNGYGISYYEFSYDLNGNLTDIKQFEFISGSTTVSYLDTRYQYTYGSKKDPYYKLFPDVIFTGFPFGYTSPNNSLDEITDTYNQTGLINSGTYTKPQYIYNDGGYPIKEVGATVDQFTYQKY